MSKSLRRPQQPLICMKRIKDADAAALSGEYVAAHKEDADFHSQLNTASSFIEMNQEVAALANENIRGRCKAINSAEYTDSVLKNGSIPIYGYVPNGLASNPATGADFREDAGDLTSFNVEEAQAAWTEGLAELGVETVSLELMTSDTEDAKKMAEFFQSQMQANLPELDDHHPPSAFQRETGQPAQRHL